MREGAHGARATGRNAAGSAGKMDAAEASQKTREKNAEGLGYR